MDRDQAIENGLHLNGNGKIVGLAEACSIASLRMYLESRLNPAAITAFLH
jgi:hypothetical protein